MKRGYKWFTEDDKRFLVDNYLLLSDKKIGELLGRSEDNIRKQRQTLGLRRRGGDYRKMVAEIPIMIWIPRNYFDENPINLDKLKLGE